MRKLFTPTKPKLRVIAAICSDFFVLFIGLTFTTPDIIALTLNIIAAIVALILALKAEEKIENL